LRDFRRMGSACLVYLCGLACPERSALCGGLTRTTIERLWKDEDLIAGSTRTKALRARGTYSSKYRVGSRKPTAGTSSFKSIAGARSRCHSCAASGHTTCCIANRTWSAWQQSERIEAIGAASPSAESLGFSLPSCGWHRRSLYLMIGARGLRCRGPSASTSESDAKPSLTHSAHGTLSECCRWTRI